METIRVRFLAEFLNEMLAVERAGASMYRTVLTRCTDEDLRRKLQAFMAETEHHGRVLEDLIREMSGEPGPASAGMMALMAARQASLLEPIPAGLREWRDLEALLEAELCDQRNWEILGKIGGANGDPAIQKAVSRVANDEDRHVSELREALMSRAPEVMLSA